MTADLPRPWPRSRTSRTSSTPRGAGPTSTASRSACSSSSAWCGRRRPASPTPTSPRRRSRRCATGSRSSFARQHGTFRGQRLAVLALGKLGSREMSATSDLDLIFVYDIPPDLEASDGAAAAGADPVLHAAQRQDRDRAHRPHQRGRALRSRHAAASLRPRRPARQLARGLRDLSRAIGLDLGAYGADAGARDPRPGRAGRAAAPHHPRHAAPAARRRCAAARRRRHARPHRPHAPPKSPWDFKHLPAGCSTSTSSPSTWRCATPPSGRRSSTPHPAEVLRRAADAGLLDRPTPSSCAPPAADVGRPEPAAPHPERRRIVVRREPRRRKASAA